MKICKILLLIEKAARGGQMRAAKIKCNFRQKIGANLVRFAP